MGPTNFASRLFGFGLDAIAHAASGQFDDTAVLEPGYQHGFAGLQLKRSGTRSMPPEQLANWKGKSKPIIVDIETVAPSVAERYSYLCAGNPAGAAFVQCILQ